MLVPGIERQQPLIPSRKWILHQGYPLGTFSWKRENDMESNDSSYYDNLPLKLDPVTFSKEDYSSLQSKSDWSYDESIKLSELVWKYDGRFQVIKRYFPDKTRIQLEDHYKLLEETFYPHSKTEQKGEDEQSEFLITNDELILNLRENLWETMNRREDMIKIFGGPTFHSMTPSLPELLQKNLSTSRRRKTESATSPTPSAIAANKKKISTPANVVRTIQAVNPRPQLKEVFLAGEMHWRGIKPSVARQVEKQMAELGIPTRPIIPSPRNCNLYRQIVSKLAAPIEKNKRR